MRELKKIRREAKRQQFVDDLIRPFDILWNCKIRGKHRRKLGSNLVCIRCGK